VHNGRLREGGRQAGARTRARRARCARQPQRVGRKAQAACHSCETRLQGVTRRRRAQPARTHYTQAAAVPRGAGRRPPSSPRTRRTCASKLLLRRARPSRAPARARSWPACVPTSLQGRCVAVVRQMVRALWSPRPRRSSHLGESEPLERLRLGALEPSPWTFIKNGVFAHEFKAVEGNLVCNGRYK
jgi:hypothetical protein